MAIGNIAQLTLFSLILMRMSGFILFNPILGRSNIPMRVKSGFIFILTMMVYSFSVEEAFEIGSTIEFMFLLLKEFMAGYVVGLVMHLFFFIVSFAGYVIDYQMGLSMATVYDPQSNAQMPVTGSLFQTWMIFALFCSRWTSCIDEDTGDVCRDYSLWRNRNYAGAVASDYRYISGMCFYGSKTLYPYDCSGISG